MAPGGRKEFVLQRGGDVDRRGDGVGIWPDGGGIICYDKDAVWGVATSDDVAWLYSSELC